MSFDQVGPVVLLQIVLLDVPVPVFGRIITQKGHTVPVRPDTGCHPHCKTGFSGTRYQLVPVRCTVPNLSFQVNLGIRRRVPGRSYCSSGRGTTSPHHGRIAKLLFKLISSIP